MSAEEEIDEFLSETEETEETEEIEETEETEETEPSNEVVVDPDALPSPNTAHPH